jgi:plasmid stabilization system protein ParE
MDEIWNYYEQGAGRTIAEKIIREIGDIVATIEDHPFAGRPRDELRRGFRSLAARPTSCFIGS